MAPLKNVCFFLFLLCYSTWIYICDPCLHHKKRSNVCLLFKCKQINYKQCNIPQHCYLANQGQLCKRAAR